MKHLFVLFIFFISSYQLLAQESAFVIENHINNIIQKGDEAENLSYYNLLLHYYDNPININKTNAQELNQLGLLSTDQIAELLAHINNTGEFMGIYELQVLPSFSLQDIKNITPFIAIAGEASLAKTALGLFTGNTNYATLGYSRVNQEAKGYSSNSYIGSPDRVQMRVRLRNPGHLSVGFSAQKDPGETWLNNSSLPTPDYLSGHIYLENQGRIKHFVLGDYKLQFGQGLVLGAGFMVGKNVGTVGSVKQSSLGILPYSSITESNYFRGSGLTLKLTKSVQVTMFYSNQHLDATPVSDSLVNAVSSIRTSGLHRTSSEINAQNQLHEQVWGGAITYEAKRFSTGILLVNTQFDKQIIPRNSDYNKYRFSGKTLLNYSWFGQYDLGNLLMFSEFAKTQGAGLAYNLGVIGSISRYVSLSLLYRSFATDFHSLYGLPFAERGSIGNEKGLYWGLKLYPLSRVSISAYFDLYRFPWMTSSTAAQSNGSDYLLRVEYDISPRARMFVQVRNENAEVKEITGNVYTNQPNQLLKSIINFDYNLESPLTFRSRIQYNRFTEESPENGWLMYQDINYNNMKFGITGRVLLFDTESYGARQYAYEKDMLFTFNTRVFNGKGLSYYLILKLKPARGLSLRLKWSYIEYANQHEIGSGNDLISGNHRTKVTGQLHYTF
jgi:hypothetical protein